MKLLYLDESGSTGLDLENKQQPFFVLAGICVDAKNWHTINDYFKNEKVKIYEDFKTIEIHTNELYNSNPRSPFYKNDWKDNFIVLEKLVNLIVSLDIKLTKAVILKKEYKKHFGNNIIVDPYLYSFAILYNSFNKSLINWDDYGIVFCDELKKMETSLEILYPHLKIDNKNIIEKTFYLDSKKNNFIQIADICSFYINKYNCIKQFGATDSFKKDHCIKMYEQIRKLLVGSERKALLNDFDYYFN